MSFHRAMDWHPGEQQMHKLTKVGEFDNPTNSFLTPRSAFNVQRFPLMGLGAVDNQGRPWSTLWGAGNDDTENFPIAQQVAPSILGIRARVDASFDPVVEALYGGKDDGEIVKAGNTKGKMVSGLSFFLEERNRVKLYGRMVAGSLQANEGQDDRVKSEGNGKAGAAQMVLKIEQSVGNCPKYLNSKRIVSVGKDDFKPHLVSDSINLCPEAIELITQKADEFCISSAHEETDMDTNRRGGPKGFLRVEQKPAASPDQPSEHPEEGSIVTWPEYSGNNLYQNLGNMMVSPRAGLCIPDYTTGDILYLTGRTEILIGLDAHAIIPRSNLAVRLHVTGARFVRQGLPFRGVETKALDGMGTDDGMSPYNPKIWYLKAEKSDPLMDANSDNPNVFTTHATLLSVTTLTPTIKRYHFSLDHNNAFPPWKPGQYVALSFKAELYMGYSHMRDDDPLSINDDFLRNFTVSSRYGLGAHNEEFEVTVRDVGSVTNWLARQRPDRGVHIELGVLGFGGDFVINQEKAAEGTKAGKTLIPFIAGGIGITPVLAQLADLDLSRFRLLWTIGIKDLGLVADSIKRYEGLAGVTELYLTSGTGEELEKKQKETLESVRGQVRRCEIRRMSKEDLERVSEEVAEGQDWYLCTAPTLRKKVQEWLPGRNVVFENFDY